MQQPYRLLLALVAAALLTLFGALSLQAADEATDTPTAPDAATLTIAHFAPFASQPISTSVSVVVSSATLTRTTVVTDLQFAERVIGASLPADTYEVEIIPTGSITPALTFTATVEDGVDYTVAAIGGANGWPLQPYLLVNDRTPLTATGKLRITHLAPFSSTLAGTEVDICTDAGDVVPGLAAIPYLKTTGDLSLPAGLYDLKIAVAGTNCATVALDLPPFALRVGQVADIFAVGLPGDPSLPLQVVADGLTGRVAVGHFAPFASDPISTSVSVALDGSTVLTNFVFSTLTGYLPIAPGSYPVAITPTGLATPAISTTGVISSFTDFTLAAIGNGTLQPLELLALEDDNVTVPPAGTARLRITHVAPFTSTLAATSVDVCVTGVVTPVVSGLQYKKSATLNLPAGVYDPFVAAPGTGCSTALFDIPVVSLSAGEIAYLYAVGDGGNLPLGSVLSPGLAAPRIVLPLIANEEAEPLPTIVELARSAGTFKTLLAALDAAGLDAALQGPGSFTVFAPTDDAFAKIPPQTLESLLAEPEGLLTQILLYHVLSQRVHSSLLYDGQQAPTLQGAVLNVSVTGENPRTVKVNDSLVTVTDLYADNGIVHVIDTVLLPPAE